MNILTNNKRATFLNRLDIALWAQFWMSYFIGEHFQDYVGICACVWLCIKVFFIHEWTFFVLNFVQNCWHVYKFFFAHWLNEVKLSSIMLLILSGYFENLSKGTRLIIHTHTYTQLHAQTYTKSNNICQVICVLVN